MVDYRINETTLTIQNSHKVGKFEMMGILKSIRGEHPYSDVWKRSLSSLYLEWIVHNFCYEIGYERERTGSVDLDNPCDRPEWQYIAVGVLVWLITFKTK